MSTGLWLVQLVVAAAGVFPAGASQGPLEVADTGTQAPRDVREPLRTEDERQDDQDEKEFPDA